MKLRLKNLIIVTIMVLLVGLTACKKKDIQQPDQTNNAVFYFNGQVNGASISLNAGVNNYYMYTNYAQDSLNVYQYIGDLKGVNCSGCENSLQVVIYDSYVSSLNGPSGADSAFNFVEYPYLNSSVGSPIKYYANFNTFGYGPSVQYLWNVDNVFGFTSSGFSYVFNGYKFNDVGLKITDTSCTSTISNSYLFKNTTCQIYGISSSVVGNAITYTSSISALPASVSYFWDFGDGTSSTLSNPTHTYSNSGQYLVSLKITDANGLNATSHYWANTQAETKCKSDFVLGGITPVSNPYRLSNVVVNWRDANGLLYSSNNCVQPTSSYFKLLSVENYHNNVQGQLTKKLHVKIKCLVSNGTNTMLIDNADAVIAVAYK